MHGLLSTPHGALGTTQTAPLMLKQAGLKLSTPHGALGTQIVMGIGHT